ncbi:MAG: DEAD/DEAH box helicase [Ktedonobacteraceae bacterium]
MEAFSTSSSGSRPGDSDVSGMADLRQGGLLAQQLPGYQERPAQIAMADLVAQVLFSKQHAIVEAPTGTGKGLSYLIPIVRSGKTAIISTATKALQEQLFFKDIPFVQQHIQPFDAALVKGFGNYLCLDRLDETRATLLSPMQRQLVEQLVALSDDPASTFGGDLDTLDISLTDDLRSRVNGDLDQCAWSKCEFFPRCYLRQMREQAQRAQVIVVNHTLLLLDALAEGAILPARDVIVVDEAHHLEDEATRVATITVKASQITAVLALKAVQAHAPATLRQEITTSLARVWQQFEETLSTAKKDAVALREPVSEGLHLAELLKRVAETLALLPSPVQTEKEAILAQKLIQRIYRLAEQTQQVCAVDKLGASVYALEHVQLAASQAVAISATPLDVSFWLKTHLFDQTPIICTSATLATVSADRRRKPTLTYFRRRVGLDKTEALERILPLTFDY